MPCFFPYSYVPDDMNFDEADLWDECTQDSNDYKGVDFSTDVSETSVLTVVMIDQS